MKITICGCGRQTFDASGVCTICRMDGGVVSPLQDVHKKKGAEKIMAEDMEGKIKPHRCIEPGCSKGQWRQQMCMKHFKQHNGKAAAAKGTGERVCVDCNQAYKPSSNVQKRCLACKGTKNKRRVSHAKPIAAIKTSEPLTGAAVSEPGDNGSRHIQQSDPLLTRLLLKKFELEIDLSRINTAIDVFKEMQV